MQRSFTIRIRSLLQRPYDGPFKVLEKSEKFFVIDRGGSPYTVSVGRLKPAALEEVVIAPVPAAQKSTPLSPPDSVYEPSLESFPPLPPPLPPPVPLSTRSGRVSRPPERYNF